MDPSHDAAEAVPIFGSARAGLRFELVVAGGALEEVEDPFVPLSDSGRYSRVLLGRIVMGADATLRHVAVKLQRSSYRPSASAVGQAPVTNAALDEQWARERASLQQAACDEVVPLLDLGEEFARSRPVLFCKKARRYFHPFCPSCLALLDDCRDDSLLRDLGLPTYGGTTVRYLYCASCKPGTFYTHSLTPEELPKGNVRIRRRAELYQDMLAAAQKASGDARARVEAIFPLDPAAYTSDAVARLWVAVSYYSFHLLALEPLLLHYDELVDLLGGAEWGEIRRRATEMAGASGRDVLLGPLDKGYLSPVQYFYRGDPGGRFPIEVLRLKLAAFTQVCRGVRAYHAKVRQPHLDINPTSVLASIPPPSKDLPARWNFQAKLIDLASPLRFRAGAGGEGLAKELLIPAPDTPKTYLSPVARSGGQGLEEAERLTIREIKAEDGAARFEIETISSKARLREYRPRDVVRIVPATQLSWLEGASLWGTITEAAERGFRVSATLPQAPKGLMALKLPVTIEASVAIQKRLHVPCDLYSLGMLLFRSVLVNDGQDLFAVEDVLQRVLQKMAVALEGGGGAVDFKRVAQQIQWQIEAQKDVFDRSNLLYTRADRMARGGGIPPKLWQDVLILGFRLVTAIEGFSFCQHHGDYPPETPEAVMDEVLGEAEALNMRLHVELFSQAERDRTIHVALDEVMSEVMGASAEGAESKS